MAGSRLKTIIWSLWKKVTHWQTCVSQNANIVRLQFSFHCHVVLYQEVRVAIAPLLRGFQAEFDAASKRTKAADSAFLAVYKKLVHMPGQCAVDVCISNMLCRHSAVQPTLTNLFL